MPDTISHLAVASLGLISLCVSLLLVRSTHRARLPLVAVFTACALIMLPPALEAGFSRLSLNLLPLSLWAHLALAPALWLYVEALTAETPFVFHRRHLRHALIPAAGLIVPVLVLMLPEATRKAMLVRGEAVENALALSLAVTAFALILVWIGQSVIYIWRIQKRLVIYRRRLRDLYANNDGRELLWLSAVTALIGGLWLALLATTAIGAVDGTSLFSADLLYFRRFWGCGRWRCLAYRKRRVLKAVISKQK